MQKKNRKMKNITIFQKAIIGSKGWGYDDSDSDLDIRFFYVQRPEDYISISKKSDNITYPIQNGEDIVGFDIGKVLKLVCSSNPAIYEIINSPIQLEQNEIQKKLKDFSDKVIDINKIVTIYLHLIDKVFKELEEKEICNTKLYIYILRIIGTINYLQLNNQFPICSIDSLFEDKSNFHLKETMNQLVATKKAGNKSIKRNTKIIETMKKEKERIKSKTQVERRDLNPVTIETEANKLFYEIVQLCNRNRLESEIEANENLNDSEIISKL